MAKKQFKAESKRLLDLMINSIYTQKEIFLRELLSNASDATDKSYYHALSDESIQFKKEDFYIRVTPDKASRTLTIEDHGIGMSKEELEKDLGTIALSGSHQFKAENEPKSGVDIIGQFGVGFYSAFMVADKVSVISRRAGSEAWKWESSGADGFTVSEASRAETGTTVILHIKENAAEEDFDRFLEPFQIEMLVKKYSDFIKYPIKMVVTSEKLKEGSKDEYETVTEDKTLNSMVPIWRRNKNELKKEDYEQFYKDKRFGFETPKRHIHTRVDGELSYDAVLYIPAHAPFDFYSKDFQKGLELYSNGVLIMEKCGDLLPDYFAFVQGLVDSPDLSLNISREMLQQDRQLKLISKNLTNKIKKELLAFQKDDAEGYADFFAAFGRLLKFGIYEGFGANKDMLQDLLLFYSGKKEKMITLKEYVEDMKEEQTCVYYATGETYDRIACLPQTEAVLAEGNDVLYCVEEVDEFAFKMMRDYAEKAFKNVSEADSVADESATEAYKDLLKKVKEALGDKVEKVTVDEKLSRHPVCLRSQGEVSIEMEKVLSAMPQGGMAKAEKVLVLNPSHAVFAKLQAAEGETFGKLANVLYNQARLIEGLPIEDPVAYANEVCELL